MANAENTNQKERLEAIRKNVEDFVQDYLKKNQTEQNSYQISKEAPQIITIAKKVLFEENGDEDLKIQGSGNKFKTLAKSVAFLVEEVMQLTPEEYDAIYSTALNEVANLEHSIRLLARYCPDRMKEEALYDIKRILFLSCWPEYYKEHFKPVTNLDIFLGRGDCVATLKRAGNVKEAGLFMEREREELRKKRGEGDVLKANDIKRLFGIPYEKDEEDLLLEELEKKRYEKCKKNGEPYKQKPPMVTYNYGAGVDKIVYQAMKECLPMFVMDTKTLFLALALPKEGGFKTYGFTKIIEGRGCYDSPLDFYFLNSSPAYQMENFELYLEARRIANLPGSKTLDRYEELYEKTREKEKKRAEVSR